MRIAISACLTGLLGISVLFAQIPTGTHTLVAADDQATPVLQNWQREIAKPYETSSILTIGFSPWVELSYPSLKQLFPRSRFFKMSWMEFALPGREKEVLGLGGGEKTLVYEPAGRIVQELDHDGNYTQFGDFLAATRTPINSTEDAQLVWTAFCDLHGKQWKEQPAIRISEAIWHLGDTTIDRVHYYYELVLDGNHIVTSARLRADEIKKDESG